MPQKTFVIGVGMTKFEKPGRRQDVDYTDFALEAATKALLDANLTYDSVQYATAGYCFGKKTIECGMESIITRAGDSACGQRALYQLGLTQIPIVNVNNK
jgi:hypothetical protein